MYTVIITFGCFGVCVCVCANVYSDYNIWLFRIELRLNPQPLLFLCFFLSHCQARTVDLEQGQPLYRMDGCTSEQTRP